MTAASNQSKLSSRRLTISTSASSTLRFLAGFVAEAEMLQHLSRGSRFGFRSRRDLLNFALQPWVSYFKKSAVEDEKRGALGSRAAAGSPGVRTAWAAGATMRTTQSPRAWPSPSADPWPESCRQTRSSDPCSGGIRRAQWALRIVPPGSVLQQRRSDRAVGSVEHPDRLEEIAAERAAIGSPAGAAARDNSRGSIVLRPGVGRRLAKQLERCAKLRRVVRVEHCDRRHHQRIASEQIAHQRGLFGGLSRCRSQPGINFGNAVDRDDGQSVDLLELAVQVVGLQQRIDICLPAEIDRGGNRPDLPLPGRERHAGFGAVRLAPARIRGCR